MGIRGSAKRANLRDHGTDKAANLWYANMPIQSRAERRDEYMPLNKFEASSLRQLVVL